MPKKMILLTIIIINFFLIIFCSQLNETLIEELDNSMIITNLTESYHYNIHPNLPFLARMSNDPNSGLINSFYIKAGFQKIIKEYNKNYQSYDIYYEVDNILRIDSIQENDLNTFNSTFIKDN